METTITLAPLSSWRIAGAVVVQFALMAELMAFIKKSDESLWRRMGAPSLWPRAELGGWRLQFGNWFPLLSALVFGWREAARPAGLVTRLWLTRAWCVLLNLLMLWVVAGRNAALHL